MCGIADDPVWPPRKGSSASRISVRCSVRMSVAMRSSVPPRTASAQRNSACRSRCRTCELTGAVARFLHRGLGSSDVVDTAQSILLVRAAELIDAALDDLRAALRDLALRHRDTAMAGRTQKSAVTTCTTCPDRAGSRSWITGAA